MENQTTIGFEIHGQRIKGDRLVSLQKLFGSDSLQHLPLLGSLLELDTVDAVEIRDFGTVGLSGPTIASDPRTPRRFVNFVRNIGVEKGADEAGSGGTYGFGKGSYYRLSSAHTIIIHTRTMNASGVIESRFMVAALGDAFDDGSCAFTGRHFFGIQGPNTAEPVIQDEADALADSLGFGVPDGETGTAILILGFSPGSRLELEESSDPIDLELALHCMMEQLIWQCWPKLIDTGDGPEVHYRVTLDGTDISRRGWEEMPVLDNLIVQFRKALEGSGDLIEHKTRRIELGRLATDKFRVDNRLLLGHEAVIGFIPPTHHVALIRKPHLVVKYLNGPLPTSPDVGWNGVFLVADDARIDRVFASAEPPTHDDWHFQNLQEADGKLVNHALKGIMKSLNTTYEEAVRQADGATEVSALAGLLGGMLGLSGFGSNEEEPDTGPIGTREARAKRATRYNPTQVNIVLKDGQPFCEAIFMMSELPSGKALQIELKTAIDAGVATEDLPGGFTSPPLSEWCVEIGTKKLTGTDTKIPSKFLASPEGKVKVVSPLLEGRATIIQLVVVAS